MGRGTGRWTGGLQRTAAAVLLLLAATAAVSLLLGRNAPATAEAPASSGEAAESLDTDTTAAEGVPETGAVPGEESQAPPEAGENPTIRVAIYGADYGSLYQDTVQVSSAEDFTVSWSGGEEQMAGDTVLTLTPEDAWFASGSVWVRGEGLQILSSHRECGYPDYPGELEIILTEGKLGVVNQLSLEEYLCRVVPGEMPSSYGLEALKVQAVCARSYAWCRMQGYGIPELRAHVDDSTNYQVYNNQASGEKTDQAVWDTAGQVLNYQGQTITAYYYSTSCGSSTDTGVWQSDPAEYPYCPAACLNVDRDTPDLTDEAAFRQFIDENTDSFDSGDGFYRWQITLGKDSLTQSINGYLENHGMASIGEVAVLEVTGRSAGGVIRELTVTGSQGRAVLERQGAVREALGSEGMEIEQHTGYVVEGWTMVPSGFFYLERLEENGTLTGYRLHGGGYGHGVGMSQSGAGGMAEAGYTYGQILLYFYPGTEVHSIY